MARANRGHQRFNAFGSMTSSSSRPPLVRATVSSGNDVEQTEPVTNVDETVPVFKWSGRTI